ncbi:MAG: ABC transporter ATP-binding protein [Ilumatobacteraceae bacterium]
MSGLAVKNLEAGYGAFQALFGLSLTAEAGVGRRSSARPRREGRCVRAIVGHVDVSAGEIEVGGSSVLGRRTFKRARSGIALVPEGRNVFGSLTVLDNLRVGAHTRRTGRWDLDAILETFPLLREHLHRPAGVLSGGQKQAVAIGRALMSNPDLLLLDEVSLGLAPIVVRDLYRSIRSVADTGTTVLVVEQDITQALEFADTVHCLLEGCIALSGRPDELTLDEIRAAYFGTVVR